MSRQTLILILFLLTACSDNKSNFNYDPTKEYPLLNPGDFWVDKFDQRGLQNAVIHNDRIYCNTIDVGGDKNFLYCLNPLNGLVVWRGQVKSYASHPVLFYKDKVIYSSYLGEVTTFDKNGKFLWECKFDHPYGGHWIDKINSKLYIKTVHWKDVNEYDLETGKLILKTVEDSLPKLSIENENKTELNNNFDYTFQKDGKNYSIKARPSTMYNFESLIVEISE